MSVPFGNLLSRWYSYINFDNTLINKAFIDIRSRPGIATHRYTAHYGQSGVFHKTGNT